jgi:hypothetical protein
VMLQHCPLKAAQSEQSSSARPKLNSAAPPDQ